MLGDVEETIYVVEDEEEEGEPKVKLAYHWGRGRSANSVSLQTVSRKAEMLFVRGMFSRDAGRWSGC